jgi:hypothetical protein
MQDELRYNKYNADCSRTISVGRWWDQCWHVVAQCGDVGMWWLNVGVWWLTVVMWWLWGRGGSVGECGGSMFGVKWLNVVMWVAQCLGVGSLRECGRSTAGDMIAIIQQAEGACDSQVAADLTNDTDSAE